MLSQVDIDDYEQPDFVPVYELKKKDKFTYEDIIYEVTHVYPQYVWASDAHGLFHTFFINCKVKKLCTT